MQNKLVMTRVLMQVQMHRVGGATTQYTLYKTCISKRGQNYYAKTPPEYLHPTKKNIDSCMLALLSLPPVNRHPWGASICHYSHATTSWESLLFTMASAAVHTGHTLRALQGKATQMQINHGRWYKGPLYTHTHTQTVSHSYHNSHTDMLTHTITPPYCCII